MKPQKGHKAKKTIYAFVLNWLICVELTHSCWNDAFVRNWRILGAWKELLFVCWTDGCVELRITKQNIYITKDFQALSLYFKLRESARRWSWARSFVWYRARCVLYRCIWIRIWNGFRNNLSDRWWWSYLVRARKFLKKSLPLKTN